MGIVRGVGGGGGSAAPKCEKMRLRIRELQAISNYKKALPAPPGVYAGDSSVSKRTR